MNTPLPPHEQQKLIEKSLKMSRPRFAPRVYYTLTLIAGVVLMVLLADFPQEVNIALIILGAVALVALWVNFLFKMRKYRKWYVEQYAYLSSLQR